jgi:glycosyltransferase involved in cell wall biosynthesis
MAQTEVNCSSGPTVSVILPTYNRAALIGRAIRSVLDQTYRDLEIVVVDDGSIDSTRQQVEGFDDPRLRYIQLECNRGPAAARNAGLHHAAGWFMAFQDSDDEWVPTKLQRHMDAFAACAPEVGVVYSDMLRILRDGTTRYHRSPTVTPGVLIDPSTAFYQVYRLGIQSSVIRRTCLACVGDFNEALPALEDLDLFIRLSLRYPFQHLPEPLVRYYETDGLSKNVSAQRRARALLLALYRKELDREDAGFVTREQARLSAAHVTAG